MKLTKTSIPLYIKLEKALRKRILVGKVKPDETFPTESELCQEFGVSRMTVRQALMILEGDNLIRREQGRGTFVTSRKSSDYQLRLSGRVDDLLESGAHTTLKLHSKKLMHPDLDLVREMNLDPEERVYIFEGLRYLYAEYNAFFQAYVPEEIGRNIRLKNFEGSLLIERVERESLEKGKRAQQFISAAVADKKMAKIIKVKEGHPLLVIKRIYFSRTGRPLEMAITSFPGDAYQDMADLLRIDP